MQSIRSTDLCIHVFCHFISADYYHTASFLKKHGHLSQSLLIFRIALIQKWHKSKSGTDGDITQFINLPAVFLHLYSAVLFRAAHIRKRSIHISSPFGRHPYGCPKFLSRKKRTSYWTSTSSFNASLTLSVPNWKYASVTSIPTAWYPCWAAARIVVPAPAKGSKILPPGSHICTTSFINCSGFSVTCTRFWGFPYRNTPGRQETGRLIGIGPLLPHMINSVC